MGPLFGGRRNYEDATAVADGLPGPPRREPPPLDRKPSNSILKRSPSGNHLESGLPLPDGVPAADPKGSPHGSGRAQRSSNESGGPLSALSRLAHGGHGAGPGSDGGSVNKRTAASEGGSVNKRMSFSDQHGMDLSTVHEVTDTHYKRTCLQRNAGLITVGVCFLLTIGCAIAIAVIFTSRSDEEEGGGAAQEGET